MMYFDALPQPQYQPLQVIQSLKAAAQSELLTCSLYRLAHKSLKSHKHPLCTFALDAYREDLSHYETLMSLVSHLEQSESCQTQTQTLAAKPLIRTPNPKRLLARIEAAEKASVLCQQNICAMTLGYNYKVFDSVYSILHENIQHNLRAHRYREASA